MSLKHTLAWFQLTREKLRLLVALSGVTFSNVLMFMQLGFEGALYNSNTRLHSSLNADLVMISPRSKSLAYMQAFPRRRLYQSLSLEGVESVSELYVEYGYWRNPENGEYRPILVFGIDPKKSVFNLSEITRNLEKIRKPNHVLFDEQSKPEYGQIASDFKAGKPVKTEVSNYLVKISGLFNLGPSFAADGNIITSDTNFQRLLKTYRNHTIEFTHIGLIRLTPGQDPEQIRQQLQAKLPNDVKLLTYQGFIDFEKHYWRTSTPIGFMFRLGTIVGFVVGIIIVYQIIYTDVSDHLPQYATLKAMGYPSTYLLSVVLQEAIVLAVLGFIPGLGLSLALYEVAKVVTQLPMQMTLTRLSTVFLLSGIMCCFSGAVALRKVQEADPADIF